MSISQKNRIHRIYHGRKAQIAIEFLLIAGIAFFVIFAFLLVVYKISENHTTAKTHVEIKDFGSALQKELLIASEVEDGYKRKINIPLTINGLDYNITLFNSTKYTYMIINYQNTETYYAIPTTEGNFVKGVNYITKNNTLTITQS
jgi:hypothetical protein